MTLPAPHQQRFLSDAPLALHPDALGALFDRSAPSSSTTLSGHLAVVSIRGPLEHHATYWWDSYEAIKARVGEALASSPAAVLLSIDSPGGLVAGCFEAARAIHEMAAAADVPLYAYVDGKATSAAYALACAAEKIFVPETGLVGSIGVIGGLLDATRLNEAFGLNVRIVTSGARKSDGNPNVKISDDAVAALQARVDELAEIFFAWVAERRPITAKQARALEAGVMHGASAVARGLADEVATFEEALTELAELVTENTTMKMMATILAALGLAADASEAQALEAVQQHQSTRQRLHAMTGQSSDGAALATLEAWRSSHEQVAEAAPVRGAVTRLLGARVDATAGELVAGVEALIVARAQEAEQRVQAQLDEAVAQGRLMPKARATAESLYREHGAGALGAFLSALPQAVVMHGTEVRPPAGPPRTGEGGAVTSLTPEEREMARHQGLSEEQALEFKQKYGGGDQ